MSFVFALSWIVPLIAGTLCALVLFPPYRPGRAAAALGHGVIIGMLLVSAVTALTARTDTTRAWAHAAPWLILMGILAGAVVVVRQRRIKYVDMKYVDDAGAQEKIQNWKKILIAAAMASLLWRGWLAVREILLRPTYPWDAWDAWAVKSKTWYLLGHYAPFVSMHEWLQQPTVELYTGPTSGYPQALAWIQVWFASAAGGWIEQLVNLPWFALWIGLLLGHYGQWRALGVSRTRAAVGMYALGSLPLLDVHAALAGYADLWVATVFGFAMLAWLRWQQRREAGQLALAMLGALVLPMLKFEGLVWSLCLGAIMVLGVMPTRWRWRSLVALVVILALLIVFSGHRLPFVLLGWVSSGSHTIEIPVIGALSLAWHGDAFYGIVQSLFVQANWHLLWWFVPLIVLWRWRVLRDSQSMRLFALLLLVCFGLLLFLFLFTDAARWAESYSAVNRLILHIVPGVISLMVLLLRDAVLVRDPKAEVSAAGS